MSNAMAREGKFTRGPWAVNPVTAHVDSFVDGSNVPLCAMLWPTTVRSEAETEANARLIAAAPALYEATTRALEAMLSDPPIGPQKTILADDVIYHLSGQAIGRAIELCRAALQSAEPTP